MKAATQAKPRTGPHCIVIGGGGAGGLELATRLGDTLGKRGREWRARCPAAAHQPPISRPPGYIGLGVQHGWQRR